MLRPGWVLSAIILVFGLMFCAQLSNAQEANPPAATSTAVATQALAASPSPSASPTPSGEGAGGKQGYDHSDLLFLYVVLLVAFILVIHVGDSMQAYRLAKRDSDEVWKKLPTLSPDDLSKVQQLLAALSQSPSGIAGTTRSILAYSLILILGIAVFHLLAAAPPKLASEYAGYADKLLVLLGGSLTTALGFYFGTKATTEGVEAGKPQDNPKSAPLVGRIDRVDPVQGKEGDSVVIHGAGFGNDGNVQFGNVAVAKADNWSDTSIKVKVPAGLAPGKIDVFVNPANGSKIVGTGLFTVTN